MHYGAEISCWISTGMSISQAVEIVKDSTAYRKTEQIFDWQA